MEAGVGGDPPPPSAPPSPLTSPIQDEEAIATEKILSERLDEPRSSEQQLNDSSSTSSAATVLTDDLRDKIVRQVEYYFSDENLPTDPFFLKRIKGNEQGFVPIAVIASFRKMKKLVQNNAQIEAALRTSLQLVVSPDGNQVRRLHLMPECANALLENLKKEAKSRTVLVKNLHEDQKLDDIRRIFGNIGKINDISIQDFKGKRIKMENGPIGQKMQVFIEYETVEAAKDAVSTLNDETNWRNGMRVKLLYKSKEKPGLMPSRRKDTSESYPRTIQMNSAFVESVMKSTDPDDETVELMENLGIEGRGKQKIRHKYHVGGHQHDHKQSSFRSEGLKNLTSMPKMPDGTRGFAIGRGKPTKMRVSTIISKEEALGKLSHSDKFQCDHPEVVTAAFCKCPAEDKESPLKRVDVDIDSPFNLEQDSDIVMEPNSAIPPNSSPQIATEISSLRVSECCVAMESDLITSSNLSSSNVAKTSSPCALKNFMNILLMIFSCLLQVCLFRKESDPTFSMGSPFVDSPEALTHDMERPHVVEPSSTKVQNSSPPVVATYSSSGPCAEGFHRADPVMLPPLLVENFDIGIPMDYVPLPDHKVFHSNMMQSIIKEFKEAVVPNLSTKDLLECVQVTTCLLVSLRVPLAGWKIYALSLLRIWQRKDRTPADIDSLQQRISSVESSISPSCGNRIALAKEIVELDTQIALVSIKVSIIEQKRSEHEAKAKQASEELDNCSLFLGNLEQSRSSKMKEQAREEMKLALAEKTLSNLKTQLKVLVNGHEDDFLAEYKAALDDFVF